MKKAHTLVTMTRYALEEMTWNMDQKEESNKKGEVNVFVQLMSGEILTVSHSPMRSLYVLKQTLRRYCDAWKPHLQELYEKDSEGEFISCSLIGRHVKEGDYFYLVVKEDRMTESLYFVYTYDGMELYRFVYADRYGNRRSFTFTISKDNLFSTQCATYKQQGIPHLAAWYSTIEEMLLHVMDMDGLPLEDCVQQSMASKWKERRI